MEVVLRTTEGKPVLDQVVAGDEVVAAGLAEALAAVDMPERHTHGFHTYPAGLHPDAARDLLALFPDGPVLDPFCGGGTVLVEARVAGRSCFGRDLSPTAVRVARVRCATPDDALLTRMRSAARRLAEEARTSDARLPPALRQAVEAWYAPHAAKELFVLREGVGGIEEEAVRELLEGVLSAILVKVSWRKSDTSAKREKHHRPAGTTAILFHKKARELGRLLAAYREAVPPGTPPADIAIGDARRLRLPSAPGLVLTSPPYPATYDYLPMQHLRRVWLGDGHEDESAEIGSRRSWRDGARAARKQWRGDTEAWMRASGEALSPGGHLVVVIGDGLTPAGPEDAGRPTVEAGQAAGLAVVARASLLRPDHARGEGRWEHVIALRRSGSRR